MKLQIDLIPKRKKSRFTLVMGVIGVTLSIAYSVFLILEHKEIRIDHWLFMPYLFVYGIVGILIGLGFSPEKLFGSAYVHIDEEHIAIKPGIRSKEQSILWSQIKSMEYKTNWFHITQTNGSTSKFSLSDLEFKVLIEARDAIRQIAAEKRITII
jgi:hypothetical protein